MAHEITGTDRVLLHKTQAWHGLGIVVQHDRGTIKDADRRAAAVLIGEAGERSADAMSYAIKTLL